MENEVRKWTQDAKGQLEQAQVIGASASVELEQTKIAVSLNNDNLTKGNFLQEALAQQLQLLETIYESFELNLEEKSQSVDMLKSYLNNTIEELEIEFDSLKAIEVDAAFDNEFNNLYDFVSPDVLDELKDEYDSMDAFFRELLNGIEKSLNGVRVKINDFKASYATIDKEVTAINNATWIEDLIEINNSLEEELASLIESLTNHYDQCLKGLDIINGNSIEDITEDQKTELFAVLVRDYEEVPEVLSEIEEVYRDIKEKSVKIRTFLDKREYNTKLKSLQSGLNDFGINYLSSFTSNLSSITQAFQERIKLINEKCDESNELIKHYQKFVKSYHNLVLELNRRKSAQEKMKKIYDDALQKIQILQEEDFQFRGAFLSNNGDFLPSDLWLRFNDDTPLIKTSIDYKDIPKISNSTLDRAKISIETL